MKILIIDNDRDTVTTLQALLDSEPYISADMAYSSDEALTMMRSDYNHYDAVMLDIMMPDKSGLDLAKIMSQDEQLKTIPVILMSSALPLPPEQFLAFLHNDQSMSAVKAAIEKPFVMEDVLNKVKAVTNTK